MIKIIMISISLLCSSSCLAKGFVICLLEKNVIFFDEHEDELMESVDKVKLNKLELKDLLVGSIASEIESLGILWTCLDGPSIHGYLHRILYIFRDHKVVYKTEVSNFINTGENVHRYDDYEYHGI